MVSDPHATICELCIYNVQCLWRHKIIFDCIVNSLLCVAHFSSCDSPACDSPACDSPACESAAAVLEMHNITNQSY